MPAMTDGVINSTSVVIRKRPKIRQRSSVSDRHASSRSLMKAGRDLVPAQPRPSRIVDIVRLYAERRSIFAVDDHQLVALAPVRHVNQTLADVQRRHLVTLRSQK